MRRIVWVAFLSSFFGGEARGQTPLPDPGRHVADRADPILGEWYLYDGNDTVRLEFDRSHLFTSNADTLRYRILDDLIAIDEFVGGVQSQGFIRKLSDEVLVIEWTSGDTNVYLRESSSRGKMPGSDH